MSEFSVDDYEGCGISWLWALPLSDSFTSACLIHDARYSDPYWQSTHSRKETDRMFLSEMKEAAGYSVLKRLKASVMYAIVRTVGSAFWEGDLKVNTAKADPSKVALVKLARDATYV